jgi:hypothetical protein
MTLTLPAAEPPDAESADAADAADRAILQRLHRRSQDASVERAP